MVTAPPTVAQSSRRFPQLPPLNPTADDDPDLRLQQDDAARRPGPGPGPGALTPSGAGAVHSLLCRREAGAFQRAAKSGDDLLVACTQESRLFLELNEQTEGAPALAERPIRFVNIRETGGWSKDAARGAAEDGRADRRRAAAAARAGADGVSYRIGRPRAS